MRSISVLVFHPNGRVLNPGPPESIGGLNHTAVVLWSVPTARICSLLIEEFTPTMVRNNGPVATVEVNAEHVQQFDPAGAL